MNGDRFSLLADELLRPVNAAADAIFLAGFAYGSGQLAGFTWRALRGLRTYFVPLGRRSRRDLTKEFGKWAVITSATSGIGLAFAREFARQGMNVVLISRSYNDLVQIVSDIQATFSVQACGIHADLTISQSVFQEIEDCLYGLEIGILVNNVAVNYDHPQYFALVPPQRVWELIYMNIASPTVMTHMVLPQMLERERGAIINVCSNAACTPPIPLKAAYTATTAFVDNFSRCLYHENRQRGIIVQTLLPGYIASSSIDSSFFTPNPQTYVRHAMETLGVSSRTCGYWPHALQSWLCSLLPGWLWTWVTSYLNRIQRKRCLAQARTNRCPPFLRKRNSSASGLNYRTTRPTRRVSNLTLRRSPSPKRRVLDSSFVPHSPVKKFNHDPLRRVSMEEMEGFNPSRTSSGASSFGSAGSVPTIPETPESARSASPSAAMFASALSFRDRQPLNGVSEGGTPRRAVSASSIDSPPRSPYLKKHSRVLVLPSVATFSVQHQEKKLSLEESHNGHEGGVERN